MKIKIPKFTSEMKAKHKSIMAKALAAAAKTIRERMLAKYGIRESAIVALFHPMDATISLPPIRVSLAMLNEFTKRPMPWENAQ